MLTPHMHADGFALKLGSKWSQLYIMLCYCAGHADLCLPEW